MALYGIVRDLVFGAKLRGWADLAGREYRSLRSVAALEAALAAGIGAEGLVVVDLTVGEELLNSVKEAIRATPARLSARNVIGFFPHVEEALAEKGREIGCGAVVRRSALEKHIRARLAGNEAVGNESSESEAVSDSTSS